jgi:hypothetical protein
MLALAHLRIDTLLAVLLGTACAMASLRIWRAVSKRTVLARDQRLIREIEAARPLQEPQGTRSIAARGSTRDQDGGGAGESG